MESYTAWPRLSLSLSLALRSRRDKLNLGLLATVPEGLLFTSAAAAPSLSPRFSP